MPDVTSVTLVSRELPDSRPSGDHSGAIYRRSIPPGRGGLRDQRSLLFGAADKFKDTLSEVSRKPKVLIIRMRHVPAIDSTAMHALQNLVRRTRKDGTIVLFSEVHARPLVALERSGLLGEIGAENFCGDVDQALAAARAHLGLAPRELSDTRRG